jgi:P4 family phage/plasmid primase-like protien
MKKVSILKEEIFRNHAPTYWGHDLPVIPLRYHGKAPEIMQWSTYGSQMPTELEMQHWLASFPRGNIGLPLGPASGLCMIDIDTEDQDLIDAIMDILPPSPWVRVGKKGMGLAYRFEGQKNFKLRGSDGGMIMEFLGLGNQMVMPPSIHPDTQKPYTANANLWDVLDKVPYLGEDIEDKLRALLGQKGFSIGAGGRSSPIDLVPAGERDVQMVRHAGYLARVVLGIDKSTSFSLIEALGHMHHWVSTYTAKVSGDAMDPEKGVAKLLEFLVKDVARGRTLPEGWDNGLTDEMREHQQIRQLMDLNGTMKWPLEEAKLWFDEQTRSGDWNDAVLARVIDEMVERIARDETFDETQMRLLFGYVHERCKPARNFKKPELEARVRKLRKPGGADDAAESHAAFARIVVEKVEKYGELRFDQGQFWQWGGSCFHAVDTKALYKIVIETADDAGFMPLVRRAPDYRSIIEVLSNLCAKPLALVDQPGINFANGFVGEDLFVADHDPKYGATFTLPFEYHRDNATRCPKFMEFLGNCWGDEPDYQERVMALQEMFAVTLFKMAPQYQRAFLLFGKAGSGKTVLLNILRSLLPPDAVAQLGPQEWGARFSLTDLIGKAANIVGELPENGMITGNVFKEVVEGNPQRTEYKSKDAFSFVPVCAHWFASNYLPVSKDTTRGFIRRWLILDFNKRVAEKDRVTNLAEIIVAEEREAIAAWTLEGLRRVIERGDFTEPACHTSRVGQMRRINNSVHAFLEDTSAVELGEGQMKAQELYDTYAQHIQNYRRGTSVSFERFLQMLEDLDLDIERDMLGDYVVRGVRRAEKANVR